MNVHRTTRRMLLQGTAGAVLATPWLGSLLPRGARAATSAPRRFIAIKSYSAQNIVDWYPTFTGGDYVLRDVVYPRNQIPPVDIPPAGLMSPKTNGRADGTTHLTRSLVAGKPYTWAPLADFSQAGVSRILGTAFNPHLSKMLLLRGLDFIPDTNHNDGGMLGNYAGCDGAAASLPHVPTIDQVLAYSKAFYPTPPALRSLHLSPGNANSISYTDDGVRGGKVRQVQARTDPRLAFYDAFSTTPLAGKDGKLVDRVKGDYDRVKRHPRLGTEDRALLERHMSFLSELQGRLSRVTPRGCAVPGTPRSVPNAVPGGDLAAVDDLKLTYEAMIDTLVAAVTCDVTRIVTLDVRKALAMVDGQLTAYYHGKDFPGSWHGHAHSWGDATADRHILAINSWIAEDVVLKVIQRLDVPEADGATFLDNSVVYWGNELGFNHINSSVPALLVGGAGGALSTGGRIIDYSDWSSRVFLTQQNGACVLGLPHNRLLVTLMQAMGLSPADYERDGRKGYGATDPLGKPTPKWPNGWNLNEIGDPLPGLKP